MAVLPFRERHRDEADWGVLARLGGGEGDRRAAVHEAGGSDAGSGRRRYETRSEVGADPQVTGPSVVLEGVGFYARRALRELSEACQDVLDPNRPCGLPGTLPVRADPRLAYAKLDAKLGGPMACVA